MGLVCLLDERHVAPSQMRTGVVADLDLTDIAARSDTVGRELLVTADVGGLDSRLAVAGCCVHTT